MAQPHIEDLVVHMRRVLNAERDLRELTLVWQMIEASAAISCPREIQSILPSLIHTRESFDVLQQELVQQLALDSLRRVETGLAAQAQCAIDVLVRNLFERTADVGFLATDFEVRHFAELAGDEAALNAARPALRQRLAEYVAKYSVYDDVIIATPDGRILARHDPISTAATSADPIIARAAQGGGFVETFSSSDLGNADRPALLYAHCIQDSVRNITVGVLVLRFRFEDEMVRIFSGLADSTERTAMVLLDGTRVIASSKPERFAVGSLVQSAGGPNVELTEIDGREYLTVTRDTRGYQGYRGLQWRGQAMTPLETAFRIGAAESNLANHTGRAAAATGHKALAQIEQQADMINRNLQHVVWNGRIMAGADGTDAANGDLGRLRAVLTQVNGASSKTRAQVALAIDGLFLSSIAVIERRAENLARLAADIMDRNLFERANDCRWWALSSDIGRLLQQAQHENKSAELNGLLDHVNGLYTVYDRLAAFDRDGVIRGVSRNTQGASLVGQRIDADLLHAVSALSRSQQYAVSPFEPNALSDGRATYVYAAAIRDAQGFAGGIAIAFNSQTEFSNMLVDVLDKLPGAIAVFVNAENKVVACSDPRFAVLDKFPMIVPPTQNVTQVDWNGVRYAVGQVQAGGYREFKRSDGYINGVRALVAVPLGALDVATRKVFAPAPAAAGADRKQAIELAAFAVGDGMFALPSAVVMQAIAPKNIAAVPKAGDMLLGLMEVKHGDGRRTVVQVLDARVVLGHARKSAVADGMVVILRSPAAASVPLVGLWVNELMWVAEFSREQLQAPPGGIAMAAPLVEALVRLDGQSAEMLQLLSHASICALVQTPSRPAPEAATRDFSTSAVVQPSAEAALL